MTTLCLDWIVKKNTQKKPIINLSHFGLGLSKMQLHLKKKKKSRVKLFTTDTISDYILQTVHLPLFSSHPSLTITTLVMLVGRVEDPGFPQGEMQLCFPSFLHSALCRSLETGSWGLQPPSQWWLPIGWKRVKISLILSWKLFSTCLNINPQINIVEERQWNWVLWPS